MEREEGKGGERGKERDPQSLVHTPPIFQILKKCPAVIYLAKVDGEFSRGVNVYGRTLPQSYFSLLVRYSY